MTESPPNNILSRISHTLKEAIRYGDSFPDPHVLKAVDVWQHVFHLKNEDEIIRQQKVSEKLMSLMMRMDVAYEIVEGLKEQNSLPVAHVKKTLVEMKAGLLPIRLSSRWADVKGKYFYDVAMNTIFMAAFSLPADEVTLPREDWDQLTKSIQELLGLIHKSHFPFEIKSTLERSLNNVLNAIADVEFEGTASIAEEANKIVGLTVIANDEVQEELKRNPILKAGLNKTFWQLFEKINKSANNIRNIEYLAKLLGIL